MELTDEDATIYAKMIKDIGESLQKSEDFLRRKGAKPMNETVDLKTDAKISFPSGCIRPASYIENIYNFQSYIPDRTLRKNLCYALQYLDVNSFFLNRISINLSAGKIFYKYSIINAYSIFEGIITGLATELNKHCKRGGGKCKRRAKCRYYINSPSSTSLPTIISKFSNANILKVSKEGEELLGNLKNLRDNIHIFLVQESELEIDSYSIETYNTLISAILYIKGHFPERVSNFRNNRRLNCKYIPEK